MPASAHTAATEPEAESSRSTPSRMDTSTSDIRAAAKAADLEAGSSQERTSIYDLYTPRQRHIILAIVASASILVPFTDTIYLPALHLIKDDLNTNEALVAASVAIYMVFVGFTALIWGPASDRFGRKVSYYAAAVAFLASSLVCLFAPSIGVLVAFRALQGAAVAAFLVTGGSVIADIFPPEQRGTANGMFMIPLLFGPILGPLIGGAIAEEYGWRSTFIALTLLGGLLTLLLGFCLPETHQQIVIQRMNLADPGRCQSIAEAPGLLAEPLVFHAPWVPLRFLIEPQIAPHALVTMLSFGTMFCSLTEFPVGMAEEPYNLSATIIGVAFLPMGIAGLVGSPIGGIWSDKAAAASPVPEARLINNTLVSLLLMPAGLLLFGWTMGEGVHLAVVLVAHFIIGVASAAYLPGIFGYISTIKQQQAGAAAGAVQATMFISAGVLIIISSAVAQAIGFGPWFTILAGVDLIATAVVYAITWRRRRAGELAASQAVEAAIPQAQETPTVTIQGQ